MSEKPKAQQKAPQKRKSSFVSAIDPSFLVAACLTGSLYWYISLPSMRGSILHHYTTEHAVEYVIVAMFVWGIVDIVFKLFSFPREILALRQEWLPPREGREPISHAHTLLDRIRSKPAWLCESRVARRLIHALDHVTDKVSAKEYREHLRYLAEQDEEHAHSAYILVRFVIGVTPVLGFLGTVIHFGTALSGISFDEMSEKLGSVVGEMGTAFNTTSVALIAAMTMMFSLFLCQRVERSIVRAIDRLADRELLKRFEFKDPSIVPFLSAMESANEETLRGIDATLKRQVTLWSQTLESLFERFDARQQAERGAWRESLTVLQDRHAAYDGEREESLRQSIALVDSRQEAHLGRLLAAIEKTMTFREEFAGLLQSLDAIAKGEGRLVELQESLAENLRVLHETEQIDKALHGLTAAIHLLTARQPGGRAAA